MELKKIHEMSTTGGNVQICLVIMWIKLTMNQFCTHCRKIFVIKKNVNEIQLIVLKIKKRKRKKKARKLKFMISLQDSVLN